MRIAIGVTLTLALTAPAAFGQDTPPVSTPVAERGSAGPLFEEPQWMTKGIAIGASYLVANGHERGSGFYPYFGDMITGSGWIAGGAGYRQWLGVKAFVDASAAVSWHKYKDADVQFEVPRLFSGYVAIGSELRWSDMTQIHYFGIGADRLLVDSQYRLRTTDVVGYARGKLTTWLTASGNVGFMARPTIGASTGWFDSRYPDTRAVFPTDPGAAVQPPSYLHGEVALTADTRDFPSYPGRGGVYRALWSRFDDRLHEVYSFQRYELEGAHFMPVVPSRWVLAVHGWGVFSDIAPQHAVPFYMLPSLGGGNTLRGEEDYRFHDRHLLLLSAESRVGMFEHMDAAIFMDAGSVASAPSRLNLGTRSYGAGVRLHTRTATLARVDVAHGQQGWRMTFTLSDPFRMGRLSRHTAPAPFVP